MVDYCFHLVGWYVEGVDRERQGSESGLQRLRQPGPQQDPHMQQNSN